MKKLVTLLLVLAMIAVAVSSCAKTPDNGTETTTGTPSSDTTTKSDSGSTTTPGSDDTTTPGSDDTSKPDDTTAPDQNLNTAETLVAYLKKLATENPNATAAELADLYLKHELLAGIGLMTASQDFPTDHDAYVAGLKSDFKIPKFKSVTQIAPMMMPSTFITNIFVLDESTDAAAYAKQILDNSNPAWNVCVVVNEVAVDYAGHMVFQVMTNSIEPETMEDTPDSVLEYTLAEAGLDSLYASPFCISASKGFEYSGIKDNAAALEDDASIAKDDKVSIRVLKLTDKSKAEAVMNEMKANLTTIPEGSVINVATEGSYVIAVIASEDVAKNVVDSFKTLVSENL